MWTHIWQVVCFVAEARGNKCHANIFLLHLLHCQCISILCTGHPIEFPCIGGVNDCMLTRLHASSGLKLFEVLIWFEILNIFLVQGSSAEVCGIWAEGIGPQPYTGPSAHLWTPGKNSKFVYFYIIYTRVVVTVQKHVSKVRSNKNNTQIHVAITARWWSRHLAFRLSSQKKGCEDHQNQTNPVCCPNHEQTTFATVVLNMCFAEIHAVVAEAILQKIAVETRRNKSNEEVLAETMARRRSRVIEVCLLKIDCSIRGHWIGCLCWSCFSWVVVLDGSCSAVHRVLVLPLSVCVCACALRLGEVCWGAWCMGECCHAAAV